MSTAMELAVRPDWNAFDSLRDRAAGFLRERDVDPDTTNSVAMVLGELIENAAKYGVYRRNHDTIFVSLTLNPATITIEVCNPLGPRELTHVTRLDRMIQWIRGFQDPFEAYLERLKEVSAQSLNNTESGLGLVRIAYEGQSVLDFVVKDQNTLAVSAVHRREEGRFS